MIALKEQQKGIDLECISLKQYVETRWQSLFKMFESILFNKLALIGYFDSIQTKSKRNEELKQMNLNSNDWSIIEQKFMNICLFDSYLVVILSIKLF